MATRTITGKGGTIRNERDAAAALSPGHMIELTSSDTVQKNSTADVRAATRFALEDENQGKDVTDAYASGDRVLFAHFQSGDEVYGILANGQNASIGDLLAPNGSGEMKVGNTGAVAEALEALDMSGSSGVDPSSQLIRMVII